MKKIVDLDKWNEFYQEIKDDLKPYDVYDDGYGDAFDNVNAWLDLKTEEEKRGKWVLHKDGSGTCTRCNTTQMHVWDMDNFQNFCGHCGAKMDLGEEK